MQQSRHMSSSSRNVSSKSNSSSTFRSKVEVILVKTVTSNPSRLSQI